jgi:hypothetical protein
LKLLETATALMLVPLAGLPLNQFNSENCEKGWLKKANSLQTTLLVQLLQKGHTKYPVVKYLENFLKTCKAHLLLFAFKTSLYTFVFLLSCNHNLGALFLNIYKVYVMQIARLWVRGIKWPVSLLKLSRYLVV